MASSETDDEADDSGALAAVGCLRAISTILESISSLPHLFMQIEPTLLPIMRRMLTSDGQGIKLFKDSFLKILLLFSHPYPSKHQTCVRNVFAGQLFDTNRIIFWFDAKNVIAF